MPDDIKLNKSKFDALLDRMLKTPPLPKADIRVAKPKTKKRKNSAA